MTRQRASPTKVHDLDGQLTSIAGATAGGPLAEFVYAYNASQQATSLTPVIGDPTVFAYDTRG